jgi:DNA-binding XRE family transcriptional regulator
MSGKPKTTNHVQQLREERLLSKAELARRAGVSVLTIDRVERGQSCRVDTKRKIILALGLQVTERRRVFFDEASPARPSTEPKE